MSEISLLSPGTEIARWAVLPRWAVFGKFPLHDNHDNVYTVQLQVISKVYSYNEHLSHNNAVCQLFVIP